jgi:nitroreductase
MQSVCREFKPFPQARAELVTQSPDEILGGLIGSYGIIKGPTAFIAFIGDMNDPHIQAKVGYCAEGIVLEATSNGLATCWVAGTFRRRATSSIVGISANEKVIAVTPVGHAPEKHSFGEKILPTVVRAHKRKPLSELTSGLDESEWPEWMRAALEAARLAPSAYNRQPWRFQLEPQSIIVSAVKLRQDFGFSTYLDCGIAMMHIEVAALDCGAHGQWEFLDAPNVARYNISSVD